MSPGKILDRKEEHFERKEMVQNVPLCDQEFFLVT